LPLYRSLATGEIFDAIQLTRKGLSESLALVCLATELGDDLIELLTSSHAQNRHPLADLEARLMLRLDNLANRLLFAGSRWDHTVSSKLAALLEQSPQVNAGERTSAWALPEIMWRLAGELLAKKAEFILPREWINDPVPWKSVADHWLALEHSLDNLPQEAALTTAAQISLCETLKRNATNVTNAASLAAPAATSVERGATDKSNFAHSLAGHSVGARGASGERQDSNTDVIRDRGRQPASTDGDNELPSRSYTPHHDWQDDPASLHPQESLREVELDESATESGDDVGDIVESVVPKIPVGEVHSHNDPAFTNLVSRQLATSRLENRSVCLLAIRVEPEEEQDRRLFQTSPDQSLVLWQQRLVNWMADHPEIRDPHAFISLNGELIFCLMDIERNTATGILRRGLVEVLTGKRLTAESFSTLSRVQVPARYHAGIASASNPGASLTSDQVIAAAFRCLNAAQHQATAAIKSIEVF